MSLIITNQKRGKRTIKLHIRSLTDIDVIDTESGETLDGVAEITLPASYDHGHRLAPAKVVLWVTDLEMDLQSMIIKEEKKETSHNGINQS